MRFQVILNRDGGTLRTLDLDQFSTRMRQTLEDAGHTVKVDIVPGSEIEATLDTALRSRCDVIMVGGGDGTVSSAAGKLNGSKKVLAILPAGTMNLFARSLAIPLQLDQAVASFADGEVRAVDLASANGRIFIHQFSIGMHAKLIKLREKREFASRLGKIRASVQAGFGTFFRPPRIRVAMTIDGKEMTFSTAGIGVTNNLFGEGHLPYADTPDGGVLGVYVTRARRKRDLARFFFNMALGRWRANDQVDIFSAKTVTVKLASHHKRLGCAMDGELCKLSEVTELEILPGALKVLAPRQS
ncbi:diacylglycerol kinase family protein [Mesorhizobium sp. CAU 1732]|uniref:diacylglycerol/lipid kinase family protein n=1 Tax=Mesorhizobium sp. CAU 1732 TaxID=3140358 RepID=UPI003261479B